MGAVAASLHADYKKKRTRTIAGALGIRGSHWQLRPKLRGINKVVGLASYLPCGILSQAASKHLQHTASKGHEIASANRRLLPANMKP